MCYVTGEGTLHRSPSAEKGNVI